MNDSRSVIAPATDRVIHVNVLLPVPSIRAFESFTRADLLVGWLTSAAEVEPRVGGKYELFWEPADRENNSTIGCRISVIGFYPVSTDGSVKSKSLSLSISS